MNSMASSTGNLASLVIDSRNHVVGNVIGGGGVRVNKPLTFPSWGEVVGKTFSTTSSSGV